MKDKACIHFLQWALPHLHMRWSGFRKVRGQVCKRLGRRLVELQLTDLKDYRKYLQENPLEWHILDTMCRITISRFWRDRAVWQLLEQEALPQLAVQVQEHRRTVLRAWSAGCGAGEEPYSLSMIRAHSPGPAIRLTALDILATDSDPRALQRARTACYPFSSIRDLPQDWRDAAFSHSDGEYCLHRRYRQAVHFSRHDIRTTAPDGPFDLVLCRNLAFTYFDSDLQRETAARIAAVLHDGGLLVLGAHERLPQDQDGFTPFPDGKIECPLWEDRGPCDTA